MLLLMGRQMDTELKLDEKFRELFARLLRRGQKRDFDKMTCVQIMVNESHLGVREKHTFVSNMNLGTLG
ncbi:hypothetical protein Tco_1411851 [Tanacetum coccineum]